MTDLLAQLAAGGGSLPNQAELLDQLAAADPRLGTVMRFLQERQASQAAKLAELEADESAAEDDLAEGVEPYGDEARVELESIAQSMLGEIEVLRARNDMLAAALGACHLCWGEEAACPFCAGTGSPGAFLIDRRLFARIVQPALRQLSTPARYSPSGNRSSQASS